MSDFKSGYADGYQEAGMIVAKGSTRNHVKGSSIDERFNDEISGSNRSTC